MASLLELYNESSGNKKATIKRFRELARALSAPSDEYEAVIYTKQALKEMRFTYNPNIFTLDNVLQFRSGNCLGLPLLIASILEEKGFSRDYRLSSIQRTLFTKMKREFLID